MISSDDEDPVGKRGRINLAHGTRVPSATDMGRTARASGEEVQGGRGREPILFGLWDVLTWPMSARRLADSAHGDE